ncbi:hypothetical protein UCRPA7_2556 [Phaeoacremonium minimum UCRPA7]|uniref:Uncharacterized protein n=1 Tax=Phaeoacremonium minimum (strain UCR-PA7) TaxID=1286976 RepID=R8BRL1_PHAM7|nr:hypothetical protein UCRPA7_2556 [Phaeoacremonium minimum UCRPA7]EOO01925.1 hypothetical protein UCRPA7_2556 [Phaeoacremonium minimum UCRPA7]
MRLASSESEDHFSDAQSAPISSRASPIPKLRVEKVSDEPSYGEVPGTAAYKLREGDAEPDEIAIIPDAQNEESEENNGEEVKSPATPGGHPIPKTVVEESEDNSQSQSHPERRNRADPPPDLVLTADGKTEDGSSGAAVSAATLGPGAAGFGGDDDEDFGDDFDDFEEGDEDADFGEFDDGFDEPDEPTPVPAAAQAPAVQPLSFPIPDFEGMDSDEIFAATEPYLNALFPTEESDTPSIPPLSKENPIFLTPRSASLWSQLVAPPPLQPPDWIRSRIRRLFLVSLGVPVDLDEILPASKQKKLILPSLHHVNSSGSLRTSTDSRGNTNNSITRLKQGGDGNASSTSVDSQGKPSASSKRRKGPPPVPDLDLVTAKQLCTTTDEALLGMTDAELKAHVARLEKMEVTSKEVLEYWTKRTDEKIGDREAFEGVIENLVKHARKVRK